MDKKEIISFFDRLAPEWDKDTVKDDTVINTILDNAGVQAGVSVLDVGCGTGILMPYYLSRNVLKVRGLDISEKMIGIAEKKFADSRVSFTCADAETVKLDDLYDCCVIYNAFPHFPTPSLLIGNLAKHIRKGGRLTIAHGSSREDIDHCHMEHAGSVSMKLMSDDELVLLLSPYFEGIVTVSNSRMLQIVCIRK